MATSVMRKAYELYCDVHTCAGQELMSFESFVDSHTEMIYWKLVNDTMLKVRI